MRIEIDKSRLIVGILNELQAMDAQLLCSNDKKKWTSEIEVNFEIPYSKSTIQLSNSSEADEVSCLAFIEGKRVSFKLNRKDDFYSVPAILVVEDLRASKRIQLPNERFPVEIRYRGGVAMGYALDFSISHVAILPANWEDFDDSQDEYEIIIRSDHRKSDLFFAKLNLASIINNGDSSRAIFTFPYQKVRGQRKLKRYATEGRTIQFQSALLGSEQIRGSLEILNVSLTGFLGRISLDSTNTLAPFGVVLNSTNPEFSFYSVRQEDDLVACRLINTNASYKSWVSYIDKVVNPSYRSFINSSELASVFVEGALLKSDRLKRFSRLKKSDYIAPAIEENRELMRRVVDTSDDVGVNDHVSAVRFSDNSWLFQEGVGGIASSGTFHSLLNSIIHSIKEESHSNSKTPRFFCGMWSNTVISADGFWDPVMIRPMNLGLSGIHISTKNLNNKNDDTFEEVSLIDPKTKFSIAAHFNPLVLDIVDYWAPTSPNQLLQAELAKLGAGHYLKFGVFKQKKSDAYAIAYRVCTYYSANVTGVFNSAFIFLGNEFDLTKVEDLGNTLLNATDFMVGTSDIVFLTEQKITPEEKKNHLIFKWVICDLLRDQLVGNIEPGDYE